MASNKIKAAGGCFPAGTLINSPNGFKNIEDIKKGDLVYAFTLDSLQPGETEFPGRILVRKVTKTFKHPFGEVGYESKLLNITYTGEDSGVFSVTGNHYILTSSRQSTETDKGFARADILQVNDTIYTAKGYAALISAIEEGDEYDFVYNFEVKELHTYLAGNIRAHNGGGGKGKNSRSPVQAKNTVRSKQTIRVLFSPGEGEVGGLFSEAKYTAATATKGTGTNLKSTYFPDTDKLGKSVYFDGTPLQNPDGSYNFEGVIVRQRTGTPSQQVIDGFSSAESEVLVGIEVTQAVSITRTMGATYDSARITIEFPQGLQAIDQKTGDANATAVQLTISRRVSAGTWEVVHSPTIKEMSSGPFDVAYLVPRPATPGTWEWRVQRVTVNSSLNSLIHQTNVKSYTQINIVNEPYNNRALIAVTVGADSTGGRIPSVALDIAGKLIKIPSNYNPEKYEYTGTWNGTFSSTMYWSDNPAWVLYDLLISPRYGLGDDITEEQIDKFSFYDAAKYCDELVPDGYSGGTFHRRFTFNAQLMVREDAWQTLAAIAAVANAKLYIHNGYIRLAQDRPQLPTRIINNSNVVGGLFSYASSSISDRVTACNVTFSDPTDNFLPKTVSEMASSPDITRYGYVSSDLVAYGANNEGQARRAAKWVVDTAINQTSFVEFSVGLEHFGFEPNEIFYLMDEDYSQVTQEGRIISVAGTTVVLSQPITITAGPTWSITTYNLDGATITTTNIITGAGTTSTITTASGITAGAGVVYIITGSVSPRQFRLVSLTRDEGQPTSHVRAIQHDPNKYSRIELGINIPAAIYYTQPRLNRINAPTALVMRGTAFTNADGVIQRFIDTSWTPPADKTAVSYVVQWSRNGGAMNRKTGLTVPSYLIPSDGSGDYEIFVNAFNSIGTQSPTLSSVYLFDVGESSTSITRGSTLDPVQDIKTDAGGTIFQEDDLTFSWLNPTSNGTKIGNHVTEFKITFKRGITFLSEVYVPPVEAGLRQTYTYSYQQNLLDGGPNRDITVDIYVLDGFQKLVGPTSAILSNPAPGIPLEINVDAGVGSNKITYTPPRDLDYEGILIWASSTNPFELSSVSLIYDGTATFFAHNGITKKQFYRFATYDSFAKDFTGATLNLSSTYSATPFSTDFDKNKIRNSSFEGLQAQSRPTYWTALTTPGISAKTFSTNLGRSNLNAVGVTLFSGTANGIGIQTNLTETPDGNGVVGGWKKNETYTVSFYAKKINGVGLTGMDTRWLVQPDGGNVAVSNPALAVEFQRYIFKIVWGGTVESSGALGISTTGTVAVNDTVIIDDVMVEEGDTVSEYKPRVDELVALQAINVTGQLQDVQLAAISATKLTGTVADAQIAALAASKITGQLSNAQIAQIDAAKVVGTLSAAQISAINAAQITGQITSTQIADGAISTPKLAAGSVTTAVLAAGSVTAATIAAGTITGDKIQGNTITGGNIVAGSITAGNLAAGTIGAASIDAGSITSDKIAANTILAGNIAAGAITTGKLFVTGQGKALNGDPSCVDVSAWTVGQGLFNTQVDATVPIGTNSLRTTNGTQVLSRMFPIEGNKTYKVSLYAKQVSGGGLIYVRLYCYNAAGTTVAYVVNGLTPTTAPLEGLIVPASWTRYNGSIKPPIGAVKGQILTHTNWNTTGVTDITDLRAEEYIGADLIVDGSINASKLVVGSITANEIAAGAIKAGNIEAGAITAAKIQAGTITSTQIAGQTITGDRIVGNTITGDKISAGSIDASKIVVGGLNGTVIQDDSITTNKISALAITTVKLAATSITTDKIVVGAVSTVSAGNTQANVLFFNTNGTDRTSATFSLVSIITTGAPVTVEWSIDFELKPTFAAPAATDYMFVGASILRNGLRVDAVRTGQATSSSGKSGGQWISRAYNTKSDGQGLWRGTLYGAFQETPLAGTHTYSVSANIDAFISGTGGFGEDIRRSYLGGYTSIGGTIVVQENKV